MNNQINNQTNSLSPDGEDNAAVGGERVVKNPNEPPEGWRKFYDLWVWLPDESALVAMGVWRGMSEADRRLALKFAKAYLDDCRARGKKQAFAGNWLRGRGWEGSVERAEQFASQKAALHELWRKKWGGICIFENSPQFAAWCRYERETNGVTRIETRQLVTGYGIIRPSEWPPPRGDDAPARADDAQSESG